ncbi:MAG: glycosyltransferase family 4 protein [Cytophagales bacterium]|nr:glycosyltransferase family 4 protein [Cytophagales bacterium]
MTTSSHMHIGFEAKRLFTNQTGLGNYSRFVVEALATYFPQHHYHLYTPEMGKLEEASRIMGLPPVRTILPPGPWKSLAMQSFWRSFVLGPSLSSRAHHDQVFHGLSNELPYYISSKIKTVVTIHDLLFLRYPQLYKMVDVRIYLTKTKYAVQRADQIIAVSQQTKEDLMEFLGADGQKIAVIHQGCHAIFREKVSEEYKDKIRKKYQLPEGYVLNVGTVEERKNARLILEALVSQKLDYPLVIVGRRTAYQRELERYMARHKLGHRVRILNDVPLAELPALYQMAQLFVYPSLFEGFGIPNLEAQHSGLPVITSQGAAFSESAGPHSLYISPQNADELAEALQKVMSDSALQRKMASQGAQYVERFGPTSGRLRAHQGVSKPALVGTH